MIIKIYSLEYTAARIFTDDSCTGFLHIMTKILTVPTQMWKNNFYLTNIELK